MSVYDQQYFESPVFYDLNIVSIFKLFKIFNDKEKYYALRSIILNRKLNFNKTLHKSLNISNDNYFDLLLISLIELREPFKYKKYLHSKIQKLSIHQFISLIETDKENSYLEQYPDMEMFIGLLNLEKENKENKILLLEELIKEQEMRILKPSMKIKNKKEKNNINVKIPIECAIKLKNTSNELFDFELIEDVNILDFITKNDDLNAILLKKISQPNIISEEFKRLATKTITKEKIEKF
jgi:hypothetical protein